MGKILQVKNLSYSYKDSKNVLEWINFELEKGTITAIIGLSGCGKTTLCECICGIIPKVLGGNLKGDILLEDKNIKNYKLSELSTRVGYVMQDVDQQLIATTVEDELAFAPENLCIEPEDIKERVDIVLKMLNIEKLRYKNPNYLSGGQKQLVAIASVLTLRPEVIILDEPLSHLDSFSKDIVLNTIVNLKDQGHTVIIIEHNIEMVEFADKWMVLSKGSIIASKSPNELLREKTMLKQLKLI